MNNHELIKLAYDLCPNFGKHIDTLNQQRGLRDTADEVLFDFGGEYTITTLAGCIVDSHDEAIRKLHNLYKTQNPKELEQFKPAFKWYILASEHDGDDGDKPYPLYDKKFDDGEYVYSWMKKITETDISHDLLY